MTTATYQRKNWWKKSYRDSATYSIWNLIQCQWQKALSTISMWFQAQNSFSQSNINLCGQTERVAREQNQRNVGQRYNWAVNINVECTVSGCSNWWVWLQNMRGIRKSQERACKNERGEISFNLRHLSMNWHNQTCKLIDLFIVTKHFFIFQRQMFNCRCV